MEAQLIHEISSLTSVGLDWMILKDWSNDGRKSVSETPPYVRKETLKSKSWVTERRQYESLLLSVLVAELELAEKAKANRFRCQSQRLAQNVPDGWQGCCMRRHVRGAVSGARARPCT